MFESQHRPQRWRAQGHPNEAAWYADGHIHRDAQSGLREDYARRSSGIRKGHFTSSYSID